LPEDDATEHTVLPENIGEALEIGVQVEIKNIAMYEKFLSQDLPEDVEEVFLRLKNASQNHLRAFKTPLRRNGAAVIVTELPEEIRAGQRGICLGGGRKK